MQKHWLFYCQRPAHRFFAFRLKYLHQFTIVDLRLPIPDLPIPLSSGAYPMSFTLLQETHIPEINATAKVFIHDKTGARLLSLTNDDENKCFGINFRTPPVDSTGIAHIMEHSVLCGSRKYPLKE